MCIMLVNGLACSGVCVMCCLLGRAVVECVGYWAGLLCTILVIVQTCRGVCVVCKLLGRPVVECVECASYWAGL